MQLLTPLLGTLGVVCGMACLRTTEFRCVTDGECGEGGSCASVGFCAFSDSSCSTGARFSDSAGAYAGQCVESGGGPDAGAFDSAHSSDAPSGDAPTAGCPSGYEVISGGQGTHRYRLAGIPLGDSANWNNQREFCASTSSSAYLAIPDDATELAAIATLSASTRFWIGVSDSATEGVWLTVKGMPQTFLPWDTTTNPDQPDDPGNPAEDCVAATATAFSDERCGPTQLRAVCECEP